MLQDMQNMAPDQSNDSILFYVRDKFFDGLPESIREKVTDTYLKGTNFYELVTYAEYHRQQYLQKQTVNQISACPLVPTSSSANTGSNSSQSTTGQQQNVPTTQASFTGQSAARPFKGTCWNCGQQGHTRRDCQAPKGAGQWKGQRKNQKKQWR